MNVLVDAKIQTLKVIQKNGDRVREIYFYNNTPWNYIPRKLNIFSLHLPL